MGKKRMKKTVYSLLWAANELWMTKKEKGINKVMDLLTSAGIIAKMYNLPEERNAVCQFSQIIMKEYDDLKKSQRTGFESILNDKKSDTEPASNRK